MSPRLLRHVYAGLGALTLHAAGGWQGAPGDAARPLPTPAALQAQVLAHQEEVEARVERCTYLSSRTTRELNAQGAILKTFRDEDEHFLIQGVPFIRTLSRDGRPLTEAQKTAQEARLQKEVAALAQTPNPVPRPRGSRLFPSLVDILGASECTALRREVHGGETLLVMDFKPRKGWKPSAGAPACLGVLAGQLRVDEAALQLVWLEARCTQDVAVLAGKEARTWGAGTWFRWEQKRFQDTWLPWRHAYGQHVTSPQEAHYDHLLEYRDYRRFELGEVKGERVPEGPGPR